MPNRSRRNITRTRNNRTVRDWNTDAQFANNLDESYLHQSPPIRSFLNRKNYNKFIIVASKGMGKTLLLRHKREHLQNSPEGFSIIPSGEESADYVTLPSSPPKSIYTSLQDSVFWQDLWQASLMISMILHQNHSLADWEKEDVLKQITSCELPEEIVEELRRNIENGHVVKRRPSAVLDLFLREGKTSFENFRAHGNAKLTNLFIQTIRSGCAVFIDSLDQELSQRFPNDLKIWCGGQIGLLKAAWQISRVNKHAKVFVTVRQEAYAAFKDTEKLNIEGSVLLIRYSQKDLKHIFELAIHAYDGNYSIPEFFGFEKIYNGFIRAREDVFSYLERHTIGVPRWLMILGEETSNIRVERGIIKDNTRRLAHQRAVANTVNEVSSTNLAKSYMQGELRLFFNGHDPIDVISQLLAYVQSTVLSNANLQRLSERYQSENVDSLPHPFCLLMNIGLLGHVAKSPSSSNTIQKFRKPYEFDWDYENILPPGTDVLFLLHPCIHFLARTYNDNFNYTKIKIGNGLTWTKRNQEKIDKSRISIFVSYAREDWNSSVKSVVEKLESIFNEQGLLADIWIDQTKMRSGKSFIEQMAQGISSTQYFILMVSRNSLESKVVQEEWQEKFRQIFSSRMDHIFPFFIDDTPYEKLPEFLSGIHSYRYNQDSINVIKLADDIQFWNSEEV